MVRAFLFIFLLFNFSAHAEAPRRACTVEQRVLEYTTFACYDSQTQQLTRHQIDPLVENFVIHELEENDVEVLDSSEFFKLSFVAQLQDVRSGLSLGPNCPEGDYQRVYYRVDEFNRLSSNHSVVQNLRRLAEALHSAGLCEVQFRPTHYSAINVSITNHDELLHHFLCMSNSESVFGTRNIGQGGRGPWGIHPAHSQRAGTVANWGGGRRETLRQDGLCRGMNAIARDANDNEIRRSDAYHDMDRIRGNARCALRLYQRTDSNGGLAAWGTSSAWGSNRHCSTATRNRLQFMKHLGELGCCSDACKRRVRARDSI